MSESALLETQPPTAGYAMDDTRENINPKPQVESDSYRPSGKLEGRAALVTGGDSGIGAAVAIAFAKEGADVAIAYYSSDDDAQSIAERIRQLGRHALVFKGDVGNEEFCRSMVDSIVGEWGRIDVLVNNAGEQTPCKSILDLTEEQIVRTFQTNIFSMFFLVKAALPHLPGDGAIVNTTSVTAYQGSPNLLDYSATKGAITAFTRSLSENEELVKRGIRVNAVAPGRSGPRSIPHRTAPTARRCATSARACLWAAPDSPTNLLPPTCFWPATILATFPARSSM